MGDPSAVFLNIAKDQIGRELLDNFLPANNAVLEQNILVVNFGDRVALFDTGMAVIRCLATALGSCSRR